MLSRNGLPVQETLCSDLTQWNIKRIPFDSSKTCCSRIDGKRCNAKITKYRRALATPTFLGIERRRSRRRLVKCRSSFALPGLIDVFWGWGQSG